jgi:hypothetical protein
MVFSPNRMAVLLVVVLGVIGTSCVPRHGSIAHTANSRAAAIRGLVVEAGSVTPIGNADILVCDALPLRPLRVNEAWPPCEREIARVFSTDSGWFQLPPSITRAALQRFELVVRETNHVGRNVAGATLLSGATQVTRIELWKAPQVRARAIHADATPVPNAAYGWFREITAGLQVHYLACCTGADGRFDLASGDLPLGTITVFVIEQGDRRRVAVQDLELAAGAITEATLQPDHELFEITGVVTAADGGPLTGLVSLSSAASNSLPLLDRALLATQSTQTDPAGHFRFYVSSRGHFRLRLSTWLGRRPGSDDEFDERELARADVKTGPATSAIELRAPATKVVTCELIDERGRPLAIDELGLSFLPHSAIGHSGSCVYAGGPQSTAETQPRTRTQRVGFVWPDRVESVAVIANSNPPDRDAVTGGVSLATPDAPCRIVGKRRLH